MKLESRLSARNLALLSLAGGYFVYLLVLSNALADRVLPSHMSLRAEVLMVTLFAAVLGAGLWAMLAARNAIRRGLLDDLWPETELEATRGTLRSRLIAYGTNGSAFVGLVWMFSDLLARHAHARHLPPAGSFAYFLIVPMSARSELLKLLNPQTSRPANRLWTENMKPLTSEHWGE